MPSKNFPNMNYTSEQENVKEKKKVMMRFTGPKDILKISELVLRLQAGLSLPTAQME